MTSLFRAFVFALLGLAFAAFGIFHAASAYPGPEILGRFSDALPTFTAVISFAFAILAILVGLALLIPSLIRLAQQRRDRQRTSAPRNPFGGGGPRSVRQFAPGYDAAEDEWPEAYEEDYDYPEADHPEEPAGRYRRNGDFDDARRVGSHR